MADDVGVDIMFRLSRQAIHRLASSFHLAHHRLNLLIMTLKQVAHYGTWVSPIGVEATIYKNRALTSPRVNVNSPFHAAPVLYAVPTLTHFTIRGNLAGLSLSKAPQKAGRPLLRLRKMA